MTIALRKYQEIIDHQLDVVYDCGYKSPMVVLPTGGGKTALFSHRAKNASGVVFIVAHRKELIFQASETLKRFEVPHGIIKSGHDFDPNHRVYVCSVQTLVNRLEKVPTPRLIVFDECHHATAGSYRKIRAAFPTSDVLGVTATPCRMNGEGLGDVFDHMIIGPSVADLTEEGFLCEAQYYAPPPKADLTGLAIKRGDYVISELEDVMDNGIVVGDAVSHYQKICDGAPMLVFCVSVLHAHHVAAEYRKAGYRAEAVDGTMKDAEREDRINGLGTGKYQVITSCDLVGEGLDVPVVTAAQFLRPTASLSLHMQQMGRVLRPAQGKSHAIILDHVGNLHKHRFATTPREWTLEKARPKAKKVAPIRTCESCFSAHESAKVCPFCGFEYPIKQKTLTASKVVDGVLVEITQSPEERREEVKNALGLKDLTAIAKARGYNKPHFWALKVLKGRRPSLSVLPYGKRI